MEQKKKEEVIILLGEKGEEYYKQMKKLLDTLTIVHLVIEPISGLYTIATRKMSGKTNEVLARSFGIAMDLAENNGTPIEYVNNIKREWENEIVKEVRL